MRKKIYLIMLLLGWLCLAGPAQAFSSFYVFGDGVSTMTNGPGGSAYYKGTYSNGRVWVEVLAQRLGLVCESNKNLSYYGHYSSNLLINLNSFVAPPDSSNALYVVWVCDADMVANIRDRDTNIVQWTNAMNASLSNHFRAITNLYYGKGARTLIMPNAVDLGKVPYYVEYAAAKKSFIRDQTIDFNTRLAALITNTTASLPGLTIYKPDVFTVLDNVVANPAAYGLKKPATYVILDLLPSQWGLNGPGTNYVYWDDLDPTAMTHEIVADSVYRMIFPPSLGITSSSSASNNLSLANVPIGLNGSIDTSTDLLNWSTAQTFTSSNATQNVVLSPAGPQRFYRLRFPFAWSWP